MTLKLFASLIFMTLTGLLIWFGLTRMPWVQRYRILFWGISIIITLLVSVVFWFLYTFGWRTPAPPIPEITYGEFPFRLEYEKNGERFIIEDTIIAEFDRSTTGDALSRARRIWNTSLVEGDGGSGHLGLNFLLKDTE